MPGSRAKSGRRRARVLATLVGGLLAVSGAVAVGAALAAQDPAPPQPPRSAGSASAPDPRTTIPQTPAGKNHTNDERQHKAPPGPAALDYSKPVRVSIPSIGVSSSLVDLGLDSEGVMETPQNPARAGWFTPSPPPGVPGASVIVGHVTWDREPAVFFDLGDLRRGDRIEVDRADGTTVVFEVRRLAQFAKNAFPTRAVYGQVDHPGLRLITCGGVYDEQTNDYRDNLIVWARHTSTRRSS